MDTGEQLTVLAMVHPFGPPDFHAALPSSPWTHSTPSLEISPEVPPSPEILYLKKIFIYLSASSLSCFSLEVACRLVSPQHMGS